MDLKNKTITFTNWVKVVTYQKLRGGKRRENQNRRLKTDNDERTVPMSNALYELIKDMPLIKGSVDPIWPQRYKTNDDSWGEVSFYKVSFATKAALCKSSTLFAIGWELHI